LGAPWELVAMLVAMIAPGVAALLIMLVWKISVHVAVVAGAVVMGALVFGPALLSLAAVVALVGWPRVAVGAHTPAQTVAGALVSTACGLFALIC
jgi:membrane-associated phospholipid phosphatase